MKGSAVLAWGLSRPLLSLALLAALVSSVGLGNELWSPDEPRVASIGRTMWQTGDWIVPRLCGEPFLEKPPFYWWVQAGVFALAGRATATLARVPSALFAFATILLTYAFGRRFFTREACLFAGLVLLSMTDFALAAHWILVDNALVFGVTGVLACFAHAQGRSGSARAWLLAGMYTCLAVAFFSKGVIGLGMPILGIGSYLLWTRRLRAFAGWHLLLGGGALAALVGLWLHALWVSGGPQVLDTFLIQNQLGRFMPGVVATEWGHRRPFWFYLLNAPGDWLPWTPFIALACISELRNWRQLEPCERTGLRLCLATSGSVLLALSISGTKRSLYLVPIYPCVALGVGVWMAGELRQALWERRLEDTLLRLLRLSALACAPLVLLRLSAWPWALWSVALLAAGWLVARRPAPGRRAAYAGTALLVCLATVHLFATFKAYFDPSKSFVPVVRAIERYVPANAPLYGFQPPEATLGAIGFYTNRRIVSVDLDTLRALAQGAATSFVLVRDRERSAGPYAMLRKAGVPHRVLAERLVDGRRRFRILAIGGTARGAAPAEKGSAQ
jgi:4-amino-4-deoxy-L-arabinose transferase-like glycosyltransferase